MVRIDDPAGMGFLGLAQVNNYGIVIILITLILLLYYRYRDVKKKREKLSNTSN